MDISAICSDEFKIIGQGLKFFVMFQTGLK
jgi:hypothetical protein